MIDTPPKPYTAKQAAAKAGTNYKTFLEAARKGQVPHFWVGKLLKVPKPAFAEMLREGKFGAASPPNSRK